MRTIRASVTCSSWCPALSALGVAHRRGGYRDPESPAFIESWFGMLKERLIWRTQFETLEQARAEIGAYVDRYHASLIRASTTGPGGGDAET